MISDEYNSYILNYLANDKTHSAIMLSAPWGTGKSYYIQKHLIPFINQNSDDRCICISLYGLKTLDEISKALYLEIRAKKVNFNNEATNTVKVIGKTIIKGVSSFFGVNLDVSEEDLQKLYNSIDLSGKLVILEDIERSYINIKQILGFVNNLVEQDGVKVLLVANEQEILKCEEKTVSEGKNYSTKLELSDESKDYLRIKEKTVSDTILFTCDIKETIQNILKNFDNNLLNDLIQNQTNIAEEILDVMQYVKSYNFRSLIFACQKATDLFGKVTNPNIKFFESTFLSIVAFSMRIKKDGQLKWNDKSNGSDLGTPKYPLPRFAYEFIKYQTFDEKDVLRNEEIFISRSEFYKKQTEINAFLSILYSFSIQTQSALESSLCSLKECLNSSSMPFSEYGKLANYLIAVRSLCSDPIIVDECKSLMLSNIEKQEQNADSVEHLLFHDGVALWTPDQENEYRKFISEMKQKVEDKSKSLNLNYDKNSFDKLINYIEKQKDKFIESHSFMKQLSVADLLDLIKSCTAEQIASIRSAIRSVYSFSNIDEFFSEDKNSLIELKEGVDSLINSGSIGDTIILLQLTWLEENLEEYISRL